MTSVDENVAKIVVYIRKASCTCLINPGAEFVCKTPMKASAVIAHGFAQLADAIEKGEYRSKEDG